MHADPRSGDGALRCARRDSTSGLTGMDWVVEERTAKVDAIADLIYAKQSRGKVRWVLAVPEESRFQRAEDLEGKT